MVDAVLKCSSKKHDGGGGGYGTGLEGYAEAFIGSAKYGCMPFNNIEDVSDAAWHFGMFLHCLAENPFNSVRFQTYNMTMRTVSSLNEVQSKDFVAYAGNLVTVYNAWKNAVLTSDRVETNGVLNTSFDRMVKSYYDNILIFYPAGSQVRTRLLTIPLRYIDGNYTIPGIITINPTLRINPPVRTQYNLDTLGVGLTQTPRLTISGCLAYPNASTLGDPRGNLPYYISACGTNHTSNIDRYYGPMNPFKADIWYD